MPADGTRTKPTNCKNYLTDSLGFSPELSEFVHTDLFQELLISVHYVQIDVPFFYFTISQSMSNPRVSQFHKMWNLQTYHCHRCTHVGQPPLLCNVIHHFAKIVSKVLWKITKHHRHLITLSRSNVKWKIHHWSQKSPLNSRGKNCIEGKVKKKFKYIDARP